MMRYGYYDLLSLLVILELLVQETVCNTNQCNIKPTDYSLTFLYEGKDDCQLYNAVLGPVTQDLYFYGVLLDSSPYAYAERKNTSDDSIVFSKRYGTAIPYYRSFDVDINEDYVYILYQDAQNLLFLKLNTNDGSVASNMRIDNMHHSNSIPHLKTYTSTIDQNVLVYIAINTDSAGVICQFIESLNTAVSCRPTEFDTFFYDLNIFSQDLVYFAYGTTNSDYYETSKFNYAISASEWTHKFLCYDNKTSCSESHSQSFYHDSDNALYIAFRRNTDFSFAKLNSSDGNSLLMYKMNATLCNLVTHMSYDSQTQKLLISTYHTSERYIVMFNITSHEFSTFSYSLTGIIYAILRYDYERFSVLGYRSGTDNLCYTAQTKYFLTHPDIKYTYASFIEVSTTDIVHFVDNSSNIQIGTTVFNLSTPSAIFIFGLSKDLNSYSEFNSSIGYNLDDIQFDDLLEQHQYELDTSLTCSNSSNDNIDQTIIGYDGGTAPTWVSVDSVNSKLVFTTPGVDANKTFVFAINVSITSNSSFYYRKVTVNVVYCDIENCASCNKANFTDCTQCIGGYELNSNTCIETQTSIEAQKYQYATLGIMGASVTCVIAISMINMSSIQGLWMIVNQFQLYFLLFLTSVFIPDKIVDFLTGFKLMAFSFSFIPVHKIMFVKDIYNYLDYDHNDQDLKNTGVDSGSALINVLSIIFIVLVLAMMHMCFSFIYLCLYKFHCYCKKLDKLKQYLYKLFMFAIYIILFMEANQYVLICTISEIYRVKIDKLNHQISYGICIILLSTCILFLILCLQQWSKARKHYNLIKMVYFTQLFSDLNKTTCSLFYPVLVTLRRMLAVSCLLSPFINNNAIFVYKVYTLVCIQFCYMVTILCMRPYESHKDNIVQIYNEISFTVLTIILIYFNTESRWNSIIKEAFIQIIMSSNYFTFIINFTILLFTIIKRCKCIKHTKVQEFDRRNEVASTYIGNTTSNNNFNRKSMFSSKVIPKSRKYPSILEERKVMNEIN